ncbi:hypothetical protein [Nocardia cyriacigeorgica]|uniref:hypothetical protein n=1 Tax=Nocardia cyriacigeorgica TaxID=135487 RepID=UPI0013D5BBAE|nr:hypothetical protein [Nocardia cyriacigeorgica]NEW28642.1 hypothetical protein [Nocardia cyriacigeorgica]
MASERSSARNPTLGRTVQLACLIGLAFAGALTSPFHWASVALVVAVGILASVLALCPTRFVPSAGAHAGGMGGTHRHALRGTASTAQRRGVVVWSTLFAAVLAWQTYAYLRQPDRSISHYDYPTLSTLLDPLLEHGPARFAGWLAWLAAGWWLVRR